MQIKKLNEICILQKNELNKSGRAWQEFIKNAGYLCEYSFDNIVSIYAQRPGCKSVNRYTEWNNVNRYVKRGSKGISIYDPSRNYTTYVFAYEDTNGKYGNSEELSYTIVQMYTDEQYSYILNPFFVSYVLDT